MPNKPKRRTQLKTPGVYKFHKPFVSGEEIRLKAAALIGKGLLACFQDGEASAS